MFQPFSLRELLEAGEAAFAGFNDDERVFEEQFNDQGLALLDDQFERRARDIQRKQPPVQPVAEFPARGGPWTGNATLGNQVAFAPGTDNRQTILKMPEWDFPQDWRITLGSIYDMPTDSNEYRWSARAEIIAGVGGAVQEFYVDWMEGTTFTVTANALQINAHYNLSQASELPRNLFLRATVSRGWSGNVALPTTTELISAPAGGSSSAPFVRIPPFARYLSLMDRANIAASPGVFSATTTLLFYPTTAGITFAVGSFSGPQILAMGNRVPIPALARAVDINNAAGSPIDSARIIFSIEP